MRIKELSITNFKAITQLKLSNLGDVVIVAGPNGCGKSCIFDATRLLKSAYGGYQPNEWHQWFGEFQINVNQSNTHLRGLMQDSKRPMKIEALVVLADDERKYLDANAEQLL